MSDTTSIEWTDATFNPWWGCTKISPGCDHCYAENLARRFGTVWGAGAQRREFGEKHWNGPRLWNAKAAREGRRLRVFCASMADVFDNDAPEGARDRLFALVRETPNIDWQLLTKRIGNAVKMLPADWGDGYANVWLGATIVNQEEANRDIPKLLATPARCRFLSMEPLLGPVDLSVPNALREWGPGYQHRPLLDWVIVGGESGNGARPMHPEWVRSLRYQCAMASVPFLFKQWGAWSPITTCDGVHVSPFGYDVASRLGFSEIGKKAAGRLLDGRTYTQFPGAYA